MAGDDYTDSGVREACENLLQDNDVGQFSSWSTKWFFNKG